MNDETKAALESWRCEMSDGDPDWWGRERLILAHIDGEPARLAAAREEQREACAQAAKRVGWSIAASPHANLDAVCSAVRATPLDATPLADRIAELEALAWPGEHRHPDQSYKAMHEELVTSLRKAEAQVAAAREACRALKSDRYGADSVRWSAAAEVLRAMDGAKP